MFCNGYHTPGTNDALDTTLTDHSRRGERRLTVVVERWGGSLRWGVSVPTYVCPACDRTLHRSAFRTTCPDCGRRLRAGDREDSRDG